MITGRGWIRAVFVPAGLGVAVAFASPAAAQCAAIGGAGSPCTVPAGTFTVVAPSPINIPDSVVIKSGATIKIPPAASPFTLNVSGDFTMEPGSLIDGDNNVNPGHGADITVNATGNITLSGGTPGAIIRANHALA